MAIAWLTKKEPLPGLPLANIFEKQLACKAYRVNKKAINLINKNHKKLIKNIGIFYHKKILKFYNCGIT